MEDGIPVANARTSGDDLGPDTGEPQATAAELGYAWKALKADPVAAEFLTAPKFAALRRHLAEPSDEPPWRRALAFAVNETYRRIIAFRAAHPEHFAAHPAS